MTKEKFLSVIFGNLELLEQIKRSYLSHGVQRNDDGTFDDNFAKHFTQTEIVHPLISVSML